MNDDKRNWDSFALLLIDVQQDFWAEGMSQKLPGYEQNVSRSLDLCRNEGIDIVHVRARFQPDKSDWMMKYRLLERCIPCVAGTPGVEILPSAAAETGEFVIYKQSFDGGALSVCFRSHDGRSDHRESRTMARRSRATGVGAASSRD